MKPSKVTNVRPAGRNHQVITVEGADAGYCRKPCPTCPWRKDAVGEFPASAFRHSANTADDMSSHTFACHIVGVDKLMICAGFLLNGSRHNMAVRLMLIKGELDVDQVSDGGVKLFSGYVQMAVANGVPRRDPALRNCRVD